MLAPDAHLSKSVPKRSEHCQRCWTLQLRPFPVVSLGAAVTNEAAACVCVCSYTAHIRLCICSDGPGYAAAAPTDVLLATGGNLRRILNVQANLLQPDISYGCFALFSNTSVTAETAFLYSKGFIKIQVSSNYMEDNYIACIREHSGVWRPDHLWLFTYLYIL